MKSLIKSAVVVFSVVLVWGFWALGCSGVVLGETLVWEGDILSTGEDTVSPVLSAGSRYRIEVQEMWWYDYDDNLAADAQYYTTDPSDSWDWLNHFPAPDGHSFVQVDGQDVYWGPFSNGSMNHTYSIMFTGNGASITFRIIDWMDQDYGNNVCHLPVRIFWGVSVGGSIQDSGLAWLLAPAVFGALMIAAGAMIPIVGCRRRIVSG